MKPLSNLLLIFLHHFSAALQSAGGEYSCIGLGVSWEVLKYTFHWAIGLIWVGDG